MNHSQQNKIGRGQGVYTLLHISRSISATVKNRHINARLQSSTKNSLSRAERWLLSFHLKTGFESHWEVLTGIRTRDLWRCYAMQFLIKFPCTILKNTPFKIFFCKLLNFFSECWKCHCKDLNFKHSLLRGIMPRTLPPVRPLWNRQFLFFSWNDFWNETLAHVSC